MLHGPKAEGHTIVIPNPCYALRREGFANRGSALLLSRSAPLRTRHTSGRLAECLGHVSSEVLRACVGGEQLPLTELKAEASA